MTTSVNWYCVHTKPNAEHQVTRYFSERLGLETYFPRLKQKKTIRRVRRSITGPLFPRYLFVRYELSSHYRAVRFAPEVIDVVSRGTSPVIVSELLIEQLKKWAGETIDLISIQPDLSPGDRVEITDGPMRGLPAVILHASNESDRVAVLLSILQCSPKMLISRSQLAKTD